MSSYLAKDDSAALLNQWFTAKATQALRGDVLQEWHVGYVQTPVCRDRVHCNAEPKAQRRIWNGYFYQAQVCDGYAS